MAETCKIRMDVHEWGEFDVPLTDFLTEVGKIMEAVASESPSAILRIEVTADYDYSAGKLQLYYERDETDDERRAHWVIASTTGET